MGSIPIISTRPPDDQRFTPLHIPFPVMFFILGTTGARTLIHRPKFVDNELAGDMGKTEGEPRGPEMPAHHHTLPRAALRHHMGLGNVPCGKENVAHCISTHFWRMPSKRNTCYFECCSFRLPQENNGSTSIVLQRMYIHFVPTTPTNPSSWNAYMHRIVHNARPSFFLVPALASCRYIDVPLMPYHLMVPDFANFIWHLLF